MKAEDRKMLIQNMVNCYLNEYNLTEEEVREVNLIESQLKAIDYAHSSTQLNIGFVKGQEVLYNFFDYKILSIRYPKVYLKPLDDNNPYIETTIDTITAKNI